jgi:pSer/pThr/pTyr-binding forkhead associated (FHA) protein
MITCSNCQNIEVEGTLFCTRCGAQFVQAVVKKVNTSQVFMKDARPLPYTLQDANGDKEEAGLSLHVLESGKVIPLSHRPDITLGRSAEGQPILPDVDLGPYQGYEKGVSRIHLVIRLEDYGYTVTDLGSVNGTQINSQKLNPRQAYPIHHGDIISLGKMNIQVLIRK